MSQDMDRASTELKRTDDDLLVAFLDGALSDAQATELAARLEAEPELAQRLDALDVDLRPLEDAAEALLSAAPPPPPLTPLAPHYSANNDNLPAPFTRQLAIAASVTLLLLSGLAGWLGFERHQLQSDWTQLAAAYHRLYTPQT